MSSIAVFFTITLAFLSFQQKKADSLKFNHAKHVVEVEMKCVDCHIVAESDRASDNNLPAMKKCEECHSTSEAPSDCVLCHTDPANPKRVEMPRRDMTFSHEAHVEKSQSNDLCLSCHKGIDKVTGRSADAGYPVWDDCFKCHEGESASSDCSVNRFNPSRNGNLVHPVGWEHEHKFSANQAGQDCESCHHSETFCSDCHAGDNITGSVHELNYRYSHGLDAKGKVHDCQSCHDTEQFCSSCHEQGGGERPLNHLMAGWATPPYEHGQEARNDIESCASCHSTEAPVCAVCHSDFDGVRGTNPPIHPESIDNMEEGPWHEDSAYQCFMCHTNTGTAGAGFCGYCHGD